MKRRLIDECERIERNETSMGNDRDHDDDNNKNRKKNKFGKFDHKAKKMATRKSRETDRSFFVRSVDLIPCT